MVTRETEAGGKVQATVLPRVVSWNCRRDAFVFEGVVGVQVGTRRMLAEAEAFAAADQQLGFAGRVDAGIHNLTVTVLLLREAAPLRPAKAAGLPSRS
jgi:hypothetical protein